MTSEESQIIINHQAELYDYRFAKSVRHFIESVDDDTKIEVVPGLDYICKTFKCPYAKKCALGKYEEVSRTLANKLPPGNLRDLIQGLTPLLSDKWASEGMD